MPFNSGAVGLLLPPRSGYCLLAPRLAGLASSDLNGGVFGEPLRRATAAVVCDYDCCNLRNVNRYGHLYLVL